MKEIDRQLQLGLKIDIGTDLSVNTKIKKRNSPRSKKNIEVTMPDGTIIKYDTFIETYLAVLETLEPLLVNIVNRNIIYKGMELFTNTEIYPGRQLRIGERRWIISPYSVKEAGKLLTIIASYLRINLEIKI